MNFLFKFLGALFTILFLWAALVQYNDPDPYQWIFIYVLAAVISVLFFVNKLSLKLAFFFAVCYLAGAFMLCPNTFEGVSIGAGDIKNIERGRESLGLLFCAIVNFMYGLRVRFVKKSNV